MARIKVSSGMIFLETKDGNKINLSKFDDVGEICWGYFWYKKDGKYGYMNEEGKIICEPIYLTASDFDYSLHGAVSNENGYGFVNREGEETCSLIYDRVWWYNNGYAKVERDGEIYYIDKIGVEFQLSYAEKMWNSERGKFFVV